MIDISLCRIGIGHSGERSPWELRSRDSVLYIHDPQQRILQICLARPQNQ